MIQMIIQNSVSLKYGKNFKSIQQSKLPTYITAKLLAGCEIVSDHKTKPKAILGRKIDNYQKSK